MNAGNSPSAWIRSRGTLSQGIILYHGRALIRQIARDPRTYARYRAYLAAWRALIGDVIPLLATTAPFNESGWGLREYSGQPIKEAPKRCCASVLNQKFVLACF